MNMMTPPPVTLSENAARQITSMMDREGADKGGLRVLVKGGGCSGFQYEFAMADHVADGDEVIERDGARVMIDAMSLMYLAGSQIDYTEEMIGASFSIGNPNATSSCSCGTSFAM